MTTISKKKKNITLDDLAGIMQVGFVRVEKNFIKVDESFVKAEKNTDKKIENLALMVAKGFEGTASKKQVENFQKEVDSRFQEVDGRFHGVEIRLDSMETEIKEIKTVMVPLVRIVATFEIDIRDLQSRIIRLEKKVGVN